MLSSNVHATVGDVSPPEPEGDVSPPEPEEETTKLGSNATNKTCISKQEVKTLKPEIPTVMVAGKPRNGKSTALNNIFGLNFTSELSSSSVTSIVHMFEVTKKSPIKHDKKSPQEEVTMQVIDTPGLGAVDIPQEKILTEMKRITEGNNFILLYCFSVSPSTTLTEVDKTIITNLHRTLGGEVWSKFVLLFTFSDQAYLEYEHSRAEYICHINDHAHNFNKLLQDISGKENSIKSIFECDSPIKQESPSNIIAIPVKKKVAPSKDILPDMIKDRQDWTDVVFLEILKKTDSTQREPLRRFKNFNILITSGVGAAAGALVGGLVGLLGGPVGVTAGVAVGGAAGGASGFLIAKSMKKK